MCTWRLLSVCTYMKGKFDSYVLTRTFWEKGDFQIAIILATLRWFRLWALSHFQKIIFCCCIILLQKLAISKMKISPNYFFSIRANWGIKIYRVTIVLSFESVDSLERIDQGSKNILQNYCLVFAFLILIHKKHANNHLPIHIWSARQFLRIRPFK